MTLFSTVSEGKWHDIIMFCRRMRGSMCMSITVITIRGIIITVDTIIIGGIMVIIIIGGIMVTTTSTGITDGYR